MLKFALVVSMLFQLGAAVFSISLLQRTRYNIPAQSRRNTSQLTDMGSLTDASDFKIMVLPFAFGGAIS